MKHSLSISILLFAAAASLTGCEGSYNDPKTGERRSFEEPDPATPTEIAEAYARLEEYKAIVEFHRERWRNEGNDENVERMEANLKQIGDAKVALGFRATLASSSAGASGAFQADA